MKFSNAWHPAKKYSEWWYFTLFCENRYMISGVFGIRNKKPHVWLSINHKKKKPRYLYKRYSPHEFQASKEICKVRIKDNNLVGDGKNLFICMREGNVELDVNLEKAVEWKDNALDLNMGSEQVKWIVPCLRGRVVGRLKIGSREYELDGEGFHDHVWHNIGVFNGAKNLREWFWGLSYGKNMTSLWVLVKMKNGVFKHLCINEDGRTISTNKELDPKKVLFMKKGHPPEKIHIGYEDIFIKNKFDYFQHIPCLGQNTLARTIENALKISKVHAMGKFEDRGNGKAMAEILKF